MFIEKMALVIGYKILHMQINKSMYIKICKNFSGILKNFEFW